MAGFKYGYYTCKILFSPFIFTLLPPTMEQVNVIAGICLSVCHQDYSKTRRWIWMNCCMSTDVGTWRNWLTFEPDPDQSGCRNRITFSDIVCTATRRILLRRENPTTTYRYWAWLFAARGSSDAWFWGVQRPLSEVNARALPSAIVPNISRVTDVSNIWTFFVT